MSGDTSKKEVKKTKNKVWLEGDVVYYIMSEPVDDKEAVALNNIGTELINRGEASFIVIDLKQSSKFSAAARKIWVKFLQNPRIKKTAIFGGNMFVRTLASFVIAATNKKNIKFFTDKKQALKWLYKEE